VPRAVSAPLWVLIYFLVAVAPLVLSLISLDPGRGFWVNLSVALGFVGLALMGLQFVIAARIVRVTAPFGYDVALQVHRNMTPLIALCVLAHPLILFVWDSRFLSLLNVFTAPLRAKFAVASVALLLVLIATSLWRGRFGLSYQLWQVVHVSLATLVVVLGLAHVILIGYYIREPWERALWMLYTAAFVWLVVWVRIVRPLIRHRLRWVVVSVAEQPLGHTVRIRPERPEVYGPGGFSFRAGQFAWINVGRSPFSLAYHPFSISSSAENHEWVEFTIKDVGEFTRSVHHFQPGDTVYLDGPWGAFTMAEHEGPGFVFVGGGVGITPLLSMLGTLADRGDRRPCIAVIGNRAEGFIGRTELEQLEERLDLTVVHVLSEASDRWAGRRGRVDVGLLDELCPTGDVRHRFQYFLCGPDPMMDAVESALQQIGVPAEHIHSERFAMV